MFISLLEKNHIANYIKITELINEILLNTL